MDADEKWYFSKEQLANTPSRKYGYDADKELSCRQQAANFIQDMGQRLQVTQLCINTAIVYMHRFYVFHSFTHFHRNAMAAAALFLAAKVEEQPRKLEHVIKVAHMCVHRDLPPLDVKSEDNKPSKPPKPQKPQSDAPPKVVPYIPLIRGTEKYLEQAQDLVMNENVLLQTLGFDVAIDHPHTHVVRCCHLVKASKDLAQTSYFMASNSLHLTTMCLQYKPTVVACFCIHLACKWSSLEIPLSNESKQWFWYVDKSVTQEMLEQLTEEFLRIFDKCPSRLKRKISSNTTGYNVGVPTGVISEKLHPALSKFWHHFFYGCSPPHPPLVSQTPGLLKANPTISVTQSYSSVTCPTEPRRMIAGEPAQVSFQQPIQRENPNDDGRKKILDTLSSKNHRPLNGPPDYKKQPPPPPPPPGQRESGYGGAFHPVPGPSQATNIHQPPSNAQFLYPPPGQSSNYAVPGPSSSFVVPGQSSSFPVPGPSSANCAGPSRLPSPSIPKHMAKPEAVFNPPKRSNQAGSTVNARQPKTELLPPLPPSTKSSHSAVHHLQRNGTSYPPENSIQQPNKTDNVQMKYPYPVDKHSSNHQKSHQKMFDNSRGNQAVGAGWGNTNDVSGRGGINETKYIKTEIKSEKLTPPSSYPMHINHNIPMQSIVKQSMSPSLPPPPPPLPPALPPPPPPPPLSVPPPSTKPPSIFSPDKMTPPPTSPPRLNSIPNLAMPDSFVSAVEIKPGRNRTCSSSSEPELIPVMPKVEDMLGFESLAKGKTAIKLPGKVNEQSQPKEKRKDVAIASANKDLKSADTNYSNHNFRSVDNVDSKPVVEPPSVEVVTEVSSSSKHKKKKKHKEHREHKDKDREKDKERKKDKHKDKHREKEKSKDKHRTDPAPIKITIPKDKINPIIIQDKFLPVQVPEPSACLKIKIPKDKLKPHVEQAKTPSSFKIKISKDALSSHSSSKIPSSSGSSRKRERSSYRDEDDKYSHSSKHAKLSKTSGDYHSGAI